MQLISVPIIPSATDTQWERLIPTGLSEKKLLVLATDFPTEGVEATTLSRMLQACKLEAEEYSLMRFDPEHPVSWAALKSVGIPPVVLLLGIEPASLSIKASFHSGAANDFSGVKLIPAVSINALEKEPTAKKRLWEEGLKPALQL